MREPALGTAQVASRLGIAVDTLRRTWRRRVLIDGMPAPVNSVGHPKWDRASIEAWLGRHHPLAPKAPANDSAPPLAGDDALGWRAFLEQTYAPRTVPDA